MSVYLSFADNPILYSDVLGDKLDVKKGDKETKEDIKGMVEHSKYVHFNDDNGSVSLDLGDKSEEDKQNILSKDQGLALLNAMIIADEYYYYAL
ncbi:MAG TPA: hypothetical protein PLN63_05770 [Paludibacteraceae bacterium]|nr:hypothetical protein [Paludibacteraceae bacterium]